MAGDSKFFASTAKGDIPALKKALASPNKDKQRDAVKKVIAMMTVGKNVSSLFTDVLNCMRTPSIEIKKLVYLYLINYAKAQPEQAILAVNAFVMDSKHTNPMMRAVAVRTMGCIRVEKITEYLCDPLRETLNDEDPYVRKTAAVCVAKLYDINPELVREQGFLESLQELFSDPNPMVVANTVAAMTEIANRGEKDLFLITPSSLNKLLAALNECTEWGQVFILDALANYTPSDARQAEMIIERIVPRLAHANSAVVLSATKVVVCLMDHLADDNLVKDIQDKLAPPLVSLLSGPVEMQYVALRNISLVVQKYPDILKQQIRVFFCKYNDPIYVKLEKLNIIHMLTTDANVDQVLLEYREYAGEVDVEFVRRAVRNIGLTAIRLSTAPEKCIKVLLDLIRTRVSYVVQESVVVIKDIFRRYPNKYEAIISDLCENLDSLDEPEAKSAMVWILGEYAARIDNAEELLEGFVDTIADEPTEVQLQLLTACAKLFLAKGGSLVEQVIKFCTQECDNPDLRDRGFLYWRLLARDAATAKAVIMADKPLIKDEGHALDPVLLHKLLNNMSTVASVYHDHPEKYASTFVPLSIASAAREVDALGGKVESTASSSPVASRTVAQAETAPSAAAAAAAAPAPVVAAAPLDLLDMGGGGSVAPAPAAAGVSGLDMLAVPTPAAASSPLDLLTALSSTTIAVSAVEPIREFLSPANGQGLGISGHFGLTAGPNASTSPFTAYLTLTNKAMAPLSGFAVQFNHNTFGMTPSSELVVPGGMVSPGGSVDVQIPLSITGSVAMQTPPNRIQVAIRNNVGVHYFELNPMLHTLCAPNTGLSREMFLKGWTGIPESNEVKKVFTGCKAVDVAGTKAALEKGNGHFIAERVSADTNLPVVYYAYKTSNNMYLLLELTVASGSAQACVKTQNPEYTPLLLASLQHVLC